jgi:hypothetical protein
MELTERMGIEINKAYFHTFANGINAYSLYTHEPLSDQEWSRLKKKVNLILNLPEHTFLDGMNRSGRITVEEKFYLFSAARFAFYFMY